MPQGAMDDTTTARWWPWTVALLTTMALAIPACDPPDLTPTSEVIRLRTLAIEAEPAEIAFGDTVTLRPVIADPWNEGYSVQWMPCVEAEIGGFAACDFDNMLVDERCKLRLKFSPRLARPE